MSRLVLSIWLTSALIYGLGVLLLVQTSIGSGDIASTGLRDRQRVKQVLAADEDRSMAPPAAQPANPAKPAANASAKPDTTAAARVKVTLKPAAATQTPNSAAPQTASDEPAPSMPQAASDETTGSISEPQGPMGSQASARPQTIWVTVAGVATVHTAPDPNSPMLYAFPAGRQLVLLGQKDGWMAVQDPKSAATGWVKADELLAPGSNVAADNGEALAQNDNSDDNGFPGLDDIFGQRDRRHRGREGPIAHFLRHAFGGF
jgi:hypothetical protein